MKLNELTITEAQQGLKKKKFTSVELTQACISHIQATEPKINALVTPTGEEAFKNAKAADRLIGNGTASNAAAAIEQYPLLGIPLIIKDNFCTQNIRTTASSKVLEDFIPPYDATVVAKLKNAGMVLLGKANMDAWAHGSSTETSDFGTTKNPWNTKYLPGGSSGGSAASVAAQQCIAAIGSETAGSIRQPASWCGVIGLKPTYGRVSRYGVVAMASSLDSPGPITKTVEDSALILQVLAGIDPMDATTSPHKVENYIKNISAAIKGKKIGISERYTHGVESDVLKTFNDSLKIFEQLGAEIVDLKGDVFDPKLSIAVYTILQRSEVSSNLARYDGIRYGNNRSYFGDEAKRRIMLGTYTLSAGYYDAYYKKALKVRTLIVEDFKKMFQKVDAFLAPTSPTTALPIGSSKDQAMFGELADILVEPSSIAGLPGINIPAGFDKKGLPIGIQVIGPQFAESEILNIANRFEQATSFWKQKPAL